MPWRHGSRNKTACSTAVGGVQVGWRARRGCESSPPDQAPLDRGDPPPRSTGRGRIGKDTMMLRSNLSLWAYTAPTAAYPLVLSDYGERIEALEFSTVAPGGFGDLACMLKLADARLPRPELGIFSLVCLRDGLFTCFGGEWADPALVLGETNGEYLLLSALGGGVAL